MPCSLIKFSQLILQGNVWRSVWRICMWILGLKGLSEVISEKVVVIIMSSTEQRMLVPVC